MGVLDSLMNGFGVALMPSHLLFCMIGVVAGTLVGVLPGIGPTGAMALLLPATFKMDPASSLIMLAGIYYGAQYGGSTTSILVNIPGEASSVVTCLDGYQMARKGRAGPALGIAACGSFIAGTLSIIGVMLVAAPLAQVALKFGPPEYFALICASMMIVTYLGQGGIVKALMMAALGLLLGTIGTHSMSGFTRFTYGVNEFTDGLGVAPIAMGLFGIGEILINLENISQVDVLKDRISHLYPSLKDWAASKWAIARGSIIGFCLGILPGGGAVVASFLSYAVEKKISKHPETFGTGAIEGVAGPESANNAASGSALIPLLSLGFPPNVAMAMLFSALLVHGIRPGPFMITQYPDIFWGLVASMYIGNALLLLLNLPMIGIWVKVLKIPQKILLPIIVLFCIIGAYSINSSIVDVYVMIVFGVLGYLCRKFGYDLAPLVLAFVLGPQMETALGQMLLMSDGSLTIIFTRPISASLMGFAILLLITNVLPYFKKRRKEYDEFKE
jgi:putative tricarboxylic transport membrane protein